MELTKEYLNFSEKKKKITVNDILETCARYFCVDVDEILSTARAKEVVNARKYAIYLSRELLDLSYPNLAKEWHPTKNGELSPKSISYGSGKTVWWICENGHDWQASPNKRTSKGRCCSICAHPKK